MLCIIVLSDMTSYDKMYSSSYHPDKLCNVSFVSEIVTHEYLNYSTLNINERCVQAYIQVCAKPKEKCHIILSV